MTEDRRTKAQLLEELAETRKRLAESESTKSVTIELPERVPEAEALAGCVRALNAIAERGQYGGVPNGDRAAAARVLRSLADRYGVQVFTREVVTEPCSRTHVDSLDPYTLKSALSSIPQSTDDVRF